MECGVRDGAPCFRPNRFVIGGPRANQDPRVVPVEQLVSLENDTESIKIPRGWYKVHEYVNVIMPTTDEEGWQYRSAWAEGLLEPGLEPWTKVNSEHANVRRRLWMTTVCRMEDNLRAKTLLNAAFLQSKDRVCLSANMEVVGPNGPEGPFLVELIHDSFHIYRGPSIERVSLSHCHIQLASRGLAFSVISSAGEHIKTFLAPSENERRVWSTLASYNGSTRSPDLSYLPFKYGPRSDYESQVFLVGMLEKAKASAFIRSFKTRVFELRVRDLRYYDGEEMKGSIDLEGCQVISDDKSLSFTLRLPKKDSVLRAETQAIKSAWVQALKRQIQIATFLSRPILGIEAAEAAFNGSYRPWILPFAVSSTTPASTTPETKHESESEPSKSVVDSSSSSSFDSLTTSTADLSLSEPVEASTPPPATPTTSKEEDEDETEADPFLQYGGTFSEDSQKDTESFKFVKFTELPQFTPNHKSLMAKHLSPLLFDPLKDMETSFGVTLSNIILSGVVVPDSQVGLVAGDEESVSMFRPLFLSVLKDLTGHEEVAHSSSDTCEFGLSTQRLALLDRFTQNTKLSVVRNLQGQPLPSCCSSAQRAQVESTLQTVLGRMNGKYYPFDSLDSEEFDLPNCLVFESPSAESPMNGSGALRSWPENRGMFVPSLPLDSVAWVNEEDHCTLLTASRNNESIVDLFSRLKAFVEDFDSTLSDSGFSYIQDTQFGVLSSCPSRFGTGLRVSLTLQLPEFSRLALSSVKAERELLHELCDLLALSYLSSAHPAGSCFELSNKHSLGHSEEGQMGWVVANLCVLIKCEVSLSQGMSPSDVLTWVREGDIEPELESEPEHEEAAKAEEDIEQSEQEDPTPASEPAPVTGPVISEEVALFAGSGDLQEGEEEFGSIIPEEAMNRMTPHLKKKLSTQKSAKRGSVLNQIASIEVYFEKNGISKNAPSLGNKGGYKYRDTAAVIKKA